MTVPVEAVRVYKIYHDGASRGSESVEDTLTESVEAVRMSLEAVRV